MDREAFSVRNSGEELVITPLHRRRGSRAASRWFTFHVRLSSACCIIQGSQVGPEASWGARSQGSREQGDPEENRRIDYCDAPVDPFAPADFRCHGSGRFGGRSVLAVAVSCAWSQLSRALLARCLRSRRAPWTTTCACRSPVPAWERNRTTRPGARCCVLLTELRLGEFALLSRHVHMFACASEHELQTRDRSRSTFFF